MSKVIIMRGIQGSGKSTEALELQENSEAPYKNTEIVSADHYWLNNEGEYIFVPENIGLAHKYCFSKFMFLCEESIHGGKYLIIVDNTNIELHEMAPYIAVAQYFNLDVGIVNVDTPLDVCLSRQTHNVPEGIVKKKHKRFQQVQIPFQWKEFVIADS